MLYKTLNVIFRLQMYITLGGKRQATHDTVLEASAMLHQIDKERAINHMWSTRDSASAQKDASPFNEQAMLSYKRCQKNLHNRHSTVTKCTKRLLINLWILQGTADVLRTTHLRSTSRPCSHTRGVRKFCIIIIAQ